MVEAGSDRTGAKAVVCKWAGKLDQHCGLLTAPRTLVPSGLRSCSRPHRLAAESGCLRPVASTAWLSRQPEEGQARLQAVDLYWDWTCGLPVDPGQPWRTALDRMPEGPGDAPHLPCVCFQCAMHVAEARGGDPFENT